MPSAPSPTFPGLNANPLQPTADDGFSFMHESEVSSTTHPSQHPPITTAPSQPSPLTTQGMAPPTQPQAVDYTSYPPATTGVEQQNMNTVTPQETIIYHPGPTGTFSNQGSTITEQSNTDVATGQPNPNLEPPYQNKPVKITTSDQPSSQTYPSEIAVQDETSGGYRQHQQNVRREGVKLTNVRREGVKLTNVRREGVN